MLMAHIAEISWRSILYAIEARNVCMCNLLIEKRKQEMASLLKINDSFRKIIITEDLIKRHMDENGVEWANVYDFLKSEKL